MVATKDHHVDPGHHWAREPDFVDTWPVHCQVGTDGEAFHPNLDPQPFDAIFLKGEHAGGVLRLRGSYDERRRRSRTGSAARGSSEVDVCGLATDHCVRATALDARAEGFADPGPARAVRRRRARDHRGRARGDEGAGVTLG